MSSKEIQRVSVLEQVLAKQISQSWASRLLGLSPRQVRRLQKRYLKQGPQGLVSGKRGKPGNHHHAPEVKKTVLAAIEKDYQDFGPTLISECIWESKGIKVSKETIRQWMIEAEYWVPNRKKGARKVHPPRDRRAQFGELVQIDGSPHDWFEGRATKCCLLVIIDDATSSLLGLRFCKAETKQDYFAVMESYFKAYGLPMAVYSDKHSVFRINHKGHEETRRSQFGRAMEELGVELIYAQTPQAKGRVERVNKTLQDRLPKLMRLAGISSIEEANIWLESYIEQHNQKFAVTPGSLKNAHCHIEGIEQIENALSVKVEKKLSKSLNFQFEKHLYQIENEGRYRLQNKKVVLHVRHTGEEKIMLGERSLSFEKKAIQKKTPEVHDDKTLNAKLDELKSQRSHSNQNESSTPWFDYRLIERKIAFSEKPQSLAARQGRQVNLATQSSA